MSILRVSIFQRNFNDKLGINEQRELSLIKSDILLLPEYFYAEASLNSYSQLDKYWTEKSSWLIRLSNSYKGTIIGGTFLTDKNNQKHIGIPILLRGEVIDWYYKKTLNSEEKKIATPGNSNGIYILNGVCFGVTTYLELQNASHMEELKKEGIKIILVLGNFTTIVNKKDIDFLQETAKKYEASIIMCSATGESFLGTLIARSIVITPYGLSWQVSESEEQKQLIKTLMLPYTAPAGIDHE